jgi:hypothetical protein
MERQYYSQRNNPNKENTKIDLFQLKKLFFTLYRKLYYENYFAGTIGFTYEGDLNVGSLGYDNAIEQKLYLDLRKENLWPIYENIDKYSEEDLFDIMEFCYDCILKIHTEEEMWANRKDEDDKEIYRYELNKQLKDYKHGFEMDRNGHIVYSSGVGLDKLVEAKIPTKEKNIVDRIEQAVSNYRNRKSSTLVRIEAVRHLGDILEEIKPDLKNIILTKDEKDLFEILNRFGIRHNDKLQKQNYNGIWLSWLFYYYLSAVHASLRLLEQYKNEQ